MAGTIEDAIGWRIRRVVGTEVFVHPKYVPLPDDLAKTELPCVTFRLTDGAGAVYLDQPRSETRIDTLLVEVFDWDGAVAAELRDLLMAAFRGPSDPNDYGGWAEWPPGSGRLVKWAEADHPAADVEFAETDAHRNFEFAQLILTVTHHRSGS